MVGKRIAAMLLAMGMVVTAAAGCGKAEGGTSNNDSSKADTSAAADNTADDADAADDEEDEDDGEMADITVALMSLSPVDASVSEGIIEKVNEITESEINVHVNLQWYDGGSYGTQVTMAIQGGDDMDLMMFTPIPGASYTSFLSAGQLMDITEYLDKYGQDIKEIQGDLINGCSLNGAIYGVGNYRDIAAFENICIRKDALEETGHLEDAQNAKTWSDVEAIMKDVVAAGYGGFVNTDTMGTVMYPNAFMNGSDEFSGNRSVDILGDGYQLVVTDPETDTVQCKYFTDEFKSMMERTAKWYDEGLIYKDAATAQDYGGTLLKSEVGSAEVVQQESGSLETMTASTGHEFVAIKVTDMMISTSSITKFGYSVPITAKNPEAAIKFLNLAYTSQDLMNTLTYGVEGRDWVMGDDGYATYPDGVTGDTVAYHQGDFLYGNQFIVTPWEGVLTTREEQKAATDATEHSKYFGFQLDNTGLENTVTACYNVVQQYLASVQCGSAGSNWEKTLTEFQDALTKAGIDELISAYQEQLDTWLAAQ